MKIGMKFENGAHRISGLGIYLKETRGQVLFRLHNDEVSEHLSARFVKFSEIAKKGYETACSYANDNAYIDVLNEVIQNVGN